MKKAIIAAGLLCSLSCAAQDFSTYTPGAGDEGVVYFLPKTEIEVQVNAVRVTYTPGEFCQYANRYLRMTGVSAEPDEYWEIGSIQVSSVGVPDPDNAYIVKLKDKSVASQMELTPDGIIRAINTTAPAEPKVAVQSQASTKKKADPRNFMTEEMLMAGSTSKMADLVAKEIYNIRESKNSLTRGQADYMPKDGTALQLMLENLEEQEEALTSMFSGTREQTEKTFTFRIVPDSTVQNKVVFRFSKRLGVLSADDLSGEPYYLSITEQQTLPPAQPDARGRKKVDGIIYNIPGKAQVTLFTPTRRLYEGQLPITQFGETEVLVDDLFNKKVNTHVIFNPNTGGIVKIDKDQ